MNTVLITGAACGLGRACVERFRDAGWRVLALDREAMPERAGVLFHPIDLADAAAIARACSALLSPGEPLHALVNNAAVQHCAPLTATAPAVWDRLMAVNLRAPYLLMQALHPHLLLGRGAVVNVASVHALASSPHIAAYAASKGGLTALTRAMAVEWGGDGIRVNALLPGAVDTGMLRAGLERGPLDQEGALAALASRTVLGRVGQPGELAEAVLFLADNARSGFMTGQTLVVDGGALARLSTE